ncbi:zinc finger protein 831 [Solea senegalensis]|nr:zinc finger protein 831 [Solea senegalensis]KAG7473159.1 zinc finger protein 831 [Solea senegalensis]
METGKLGCAPVHIGSVAAQTERRMDIQAPLTAVYIHTVPTLPTQPYPQLPAAAQEPATLHLALPLTLHIAGGLQSPPGLNLTAAPPTAKPKSAGKHVCPHCGRDCMKPSVLEKHLRCHTGERPYPCTTCRVSFKTQSNLYKHKRTQAHARLSSESEQSSLGSLDSMSSSRETQMSSLSLDEHIEESGSMKKDAALSAPAEIMCADSATKVYSVKTQGYDLTPVNHKTASKENAMARKEEKPMMDNEQPLNVCRHLPLQRQKATLFSKQWESSVSRGKSQSHESTDSGFSESSDHYSSPGSVLPDHSMDSLTESNKEHLEETTDTHRSSEPGQGAQEPKDTAREQEQKTLEERISKLISENTAVVEDKQLENVRPRKTILSKQGSIDLPMPYTYKDSFHFDMRNSKTQNVGLQRNRMPGFYSSVPTQHSTTMEHATLTRSNSLPFNVTLLQPERSSTASSFQRDYLNLVRRGSSGQINPVGFATKPVNQQSSTHRPLVRQTAVDCNHATDGLFMNSSVEEASTSSLSCDGDGSDICGEPSNRKFRRKKAQKFAYDKWYMYGGGIFKKLYDTEKGVDNNALKGRKCTNLEHEGSQKRSSAASKETVTTGSMINITSSRPTVCHQGCPPAKQSVVSSVDLNVRTNPHYSSCSSLKTPIHRNLSLSVLPLSSVGSLVSHTTDSTCSIKTGALINDENCADATSHLCEAHVPSDRKKQRTDDKIASQLEMKTDSNTPTHLPRAVIGSAPEQETNFRYSSLQKNQERTQLKAALFSSYTMNANALPLSTLTPTSILSTANTSFLPKYQLKLPSAAQPDSNTSPHVVDKQSGADCCTFNSSLSAPTEQTCPSVTTPEKTSCDSVTSPLMQTCDLKKANAFCSTQAQPLLPCTATTLCQVETSQFVDIRTSSPTVVHRQFAGNRTNAACPQDFQTEECSTLLQPSKSASAQLPTPVASVVGNFPAICTTTTAKNQTCAAAGAAFSQFQLNSSPPLQHSQLLPVPDQLNPENRGHARQNTPNVPCHVVPFDQVQPTAHNVFHVHTADLQICLQIISDEQLALIAPQIERQAESSLSQRPAIEAAEGTQNKTQSCGTVGSSSEIREHLAVDGHQKESDQSESLPTLNTERPGLFGRAQLNIQMTEHNNSNQATVSAASKPPETLGLMLQSHKCSNLTETLSSSGDVVSTAASILHNAVQPGRDQPSQEEHGLSLNHCADEQLFLERRVSHGGLVVQSLSSQHKLNMTCLSLSSVNQNIMGSEPQSKESQQKLEIQGASCNVRIPESKGDALPSLQIGFNKAADVACADASVCLLSISKVTRQFNSPASICCSSPPETSLSQNPSKHEPKQSLVNSVLLSQTTLPDSQEVISSVHSEQQEEQFTSVSLNIEVERPKDTPSVLTSIQSPAAGLTEGDSLSECRAQKELQTWGPGQSDGANWRPKPSQEAGERNHQRIDGQRSEGAMLEDKNGGMKTDQVPGQKNNMELNCKNTLLSDVTKPEGEDTEVKVDSFKDPWLSEQHLSQTHSGMSEYYPLSPQQAPSTSNNLNVPPSGSQTSHFKSQQPPLEMNIYFSQHWENRIHIQRTQNTIDPNSSHFIKTHAQAKETNNSSSLVESSLLQTDLLHEDQMQDQSIQLRDTAGNNGTAASHSANKTLDSHKSPSLSVDKKTPSTTQHCQVTDSLQVSRSSVGWTGNTQASNTNMLSNKSGAPSKPCAYPEPEQHTEDQAPDEYTTHSSNSGRHDTASKYQSFFMASQLHAYHPAESLTSGVRPVQSCQDYTEDSSSSDDEGKLIIEL